MSQLYEVIYSLGEREPSGTFIGEGGMQYLRITVEATSGTNAQRIVESMFGGRNRCLAGSGTLIG
jgi:hypothetical protein